VPGGLDAAALTAMAGEATRGFDRMLGDLEAVLGRLGGR